jgi:tetratricopeptide (TPR) repeat protein
LLRSVLDSYPDERELHESVHLYLNVCERHNGKAKSARPMNTEERIYAATLALNSGDLDQALAHVGRAVSDDPGNDHAHYTRAIALAARGQRTEAVSSLARAIELNPENRGLARHDPDLESLRQATDVRQVVDTLLAAPRRRGGSRSRPSR